MEMETKTLKKILLYTEAALFAAALLKVFGVRLIADWGAWWLVQILVGLAFAALFISENKTEIEKKIEELQKKQSGPKDN